MYGFSCSHCGQKELFHNLSSNTELYQQDSSLTNGWSLVDYGEEFDVIDQLDTHKPGYRMHFNNCPGFTYSKNISFITLVREVIAYPGTIHYIEERLAKRARKLIAKMEGVKNSRLTYPQNSTIYIIAGKNGGSKCYAGEEKNIISPTRKNSLLRREFLFCKLFAYIAKKEYAIIS